MNGNTFCDEAHLRLILTGIIILAIVYLAVNAHDINLLLTLLALIAGIALPTRAVVNTIKNGVK